MAKREERAVFAALQTFAESVTAAMTSTTPGEPEEQLRGPFRLLMEEIGHALARPIVPIGEVRLAGRLGKPDYAIEASQALVGYVELKAQGVGVNVGRFKADNHEQWKRFSAIPNLSLRLPAVPSGPPSESAVRCESD